MEKLAVIKEFARKDGDTGSPEVQVAVLTAEIKHLTEHLKSHKKDNSSRRGLIGKVTRRRKLLDYLKRESHDRYQTIIQRLELRH